MAKDDLFRRSFEAGTAFLDMTRERAEALVKDLVKAGEVSKGRAQKLVDEVVERSRKSTEELREVIRRELADQVATLGLATKDDVSRLEARLEAMSTEPPAGAAFTADAGTVAGPAAGPRSTPTSTKGAPVTKSTPRKRGTTPPMTAAAAQKAKKATKAAKAATTAPSPRKAKPASEAPVSPPEPGAPMGGPPPNGPAGG